MATPKGTSTLVNVNCDEDTTQMGTPKGPLKWGSIRQPDEGSKSLEIIEPKNEAIQTPTRRITRSIIVFSDSKSRPDASPVIRDSGNGTQEVKNTSQWSKNCKRQMENVAADSGSKKKKVVPHAIEAFAYVLPCLMVNINIWQPKVVEHLESVDPITVKIQDGIPQDDYEHNCGMYVIKFAEYIIHQKIDVMADTFDPKIARLYLAAQLYKHVCEKVIEGYETDFDLVSCSIRRDRKMKGIVIA